MAFQLHIVTPEGEVFSGEVRRVGLPGAEGDFAVLEGHERFLSPLRIGEVEIQNQAEPKWAAISGGFADVDGEQVTLLVETCELAADIDVARAERARNRAEEELKRLEAQKAEEKDYTLQESALQRAIIRMQVAAKPH